MTERTINAERVEQLIDVFGSFDENVRKIEDAFGIKITNRNNELKVTGDEEAADKGCRAIEALLALSAKGEEIDEQKVRYLINLVNTGNEDQVSKMAKDVVCVTAKGRPVKAKTIGQQNYLKAIEKNTITIGVGPAGTGKTYLAVAEAVAAFRAKNVNRIILTRPAVEAGERLGFLPGDKVSGLKEAIRVLDGVEDIQICRLTPADVVRHVLVQRIVAAYDKYEKNRLPDERARTFTKKPDWKREKK